MWVIAAFTENGNPKTGLSPTITGYDLSDDSVVINAQSMAEIANGIYKYNFSTYDSAKDYVYICDGTASVPVFERYVFGNNAGG